MITVSTKRGFGRTVREYRQRAGLSQEELARRAGAGVRTIGNIEAGRTSPRLSTVRLLADTLGLEGGDRDRFCALATSGEPDGPISQPRVVPAQLPMDVHGFTGRTAQLEALHAGATAGAQQPTALSIIAISGTAGIGKTALAVHWAHQIAGRFPDGQLFVNLHGYDSYQLVTPVEALAQFLSALGVASQDIPVDVDERAARYRTEVAGRRMLIVLDNARTVEQVRPLLPGTPSCVVVVTSRDSLAGLIAVHGARRVDLDLLPSADAIALLHRLIGPRVKAEPHAAATLAEQCARLPLALRVAATETSRPARTPVSATPIKGSENASEPGDTTSALWLSSTTSDPPMPTTSWPISPHSTASRTAGQPR